MAKAKKLPSGMWRTLVYSHTEKDGEKDKRIYESFTAETKAESEFLAAEFAKDKNKTKKKKVNNKELTVYQTIEKYIKLSSLLSDTTLRGYKVIKEYAFKDIMHAKVKDIDDIIMQEAINSEATRKNPRGKTISAKTVANEYGLISSAISTLCNVSFNIKLPKRARKNKEYPSADLVFNAIRGTTIELPCMLAIWLSFSMSEIRGLKCSSISNGNISIDRVMVETENGIQVKEIAKAENRIRKHQIPAYIMALIEKSETYVNFIENGEDCFLVPLTRNMIYGRLETIGKENGFKISFHDLRHLNASIMLMLGIPDKYAMERGGWKTSYVMKEVYQHTFSKERKIVDGKINNYFELLLEGKE